MVQRGVWPWPAQIAAAAELRYSSRRPDAEVARELGISRRTLLRWKQRPDFRAATASIEHSRAAGLPRRQWDSGTWLAASAVQLARRRHRRGDLLLSRGAQVGAGECRLPRAFHSVRGAAKLGGR